MKKLSDVAGDKSNFDIEWLILIAVAKELGLSKEEILTFLRRASSSDQSRSV